MTDQELKDLVASLAIQSDRLEAQMDKTDKKLKEIGRQLGEIGHSNGDVAENYFFNSLEENKKLGKIKFDYITKNLKYRKHRLEDEYDIFLENGNSVGIIEVKYKVRKDHIDELLEKKSQNFRILFPDYKDYKLYIGIAGLSIDAENEQYATENGLVVLKQKGDVMQMNSRGMKAF